MKPGMKMLLISGRGNDRDMESNRDRRGREHYETGRYAPRNNYDGMEDNYPMRENYGMENRYDDMESRRRYSRDSRGRFRSDGGYSRMGDDDWMEDNHRKRNRGEEMEAGWYPNRPFPVYEGGERMNQIGFNAGNEFPSSNYSMDATYGGNSPNDERQAGYSAGSSDKLTKELAEEWTREMKNEDGTKGPHWTMEQAKQVMAQRGVSCDPIEFWAVLNMMYSDYCAVFKKHNVNKMDLYVDLACAWINDKDAQHGKTARYFEEIVKH